MKTSIWLLLVSFLTGCASNEGVISQGLRESPTGKLVRGEIHPDQYLSEVEKANENANAQAQFEMDREPTRAFNTKTKRFEYVPKDTQQYWSEENQRWEFTPVNDDDDE